jgi:hypothetical protein
MTTRRRVQRFRNRLLAGLFVALLVLASPAVTYALQVRSQVTTLSNAAGSAANVTYTFGSYRTRNNETADQVQVTFPAGTDVSAATAISPVGSLTVAGQTVTVVFATPIAGLTGFDITLGGITNPATAGTYNVGNLTVELTDKWGSAFTETVTTADYTITATTLTISVSSTALDFGTLLPDATPAAKSVSVTVNADTPYNMTRTLTGDVGPLGLSVAGLAQGAKPAGAAVYAESVSVAPGWDAPADTTLTAQILYSVTP